MINKLIDNIEFNAERSAKALDYYENNCYLSANITEDIKLNNIIDDLILIVKEISDLDKSIIEEYLDNQIPLIISALLKIVIIIQREQQRLDKQITALNKLKKVIT